MPRAIFHLIRTALARSHFDYFQLLSGSCLPLRPVDELRTHLEAGWKPIHADVLNLDSDERVMMSHGHRVFCRAEKLASRLLSRSRRWYLGDDPITVQEANLGIHDRPDPDSQLTAWQWLGKQIHQAARAGLLDNHPFHGDTAPLVGSLWFCLRRDVCEYLVEQEDIQRARALPDEPQGVRRDPLSYPARQLAVRHRAVQSPGQRLHRLASAAFQHRGSADPGRQRQVLRDENSKPTSTTTCGCTCCAVLQPTVGSSATYSIA